ncbi:uncharacterized protein LOC143276063 [Babylonia areolata]|uniref:uncharacterized protein LOC143276063 n=1 Tax=Babylonia areolata TaxID=304850 RepID=UPI003FD01368
MCAKKPRQQTCSFSLFLCLVFAAESGSFSLSSQSCRKIDACSCLLSNGDLVDLHFSGRSEDGVPVFHYQSSPWSDYFKYSPCKGLACGDHLTDASLCIDDSIQRPSVELGTLSSAQFLVTGENITLIYESNDTGRTVTSQVSLQCSHSREQFVLDSNTSSVYNFTLYSHCGCPGLCGRSSHPTTGMSAGTVLLLIFFSALFLYFGIGCLFRRVMYRVEGCAEMVPHRGFWFSLPSLIKDGYLFFISPCIGNRAEYRTYDKL